MTKILLFQSFSLKTNIIKIKIVKSDKKNHTKNNKLEKHIKTKMSNIILLYLKSLSYYKCLY